MEPRPGPKRRQASVPCPSFTVPALRRVAGLLLVGASLAGPALSGAATADRSAGTVENVIVVAKTGGAFTSVADALASIVSPSETNRFLVKVMPGVYTEGDVSIVGPFVHLQGSGPNVTVIESARSAGTPSPAAATLQLDDGGRVSHLTIRNTGTGVFGIALHSATATRAASVAHAVLEAVGAGGTGHFGAYLNDSEPTIEHSVLRATGAVGFGTGVNAALGIVNSAGGFPQPLVVDSRLIGGAGTGLTCADSTGTGFGIQATNASPDVRNSFVCGGHRGIFLGVAGNAQIRGSQILVSATIDAFLFETTGTAAVLVATSEVSYASKHTGAGDLVCVHSYKPNYTAATDGSTSAAACN